MQAVAVMTFSDNSAESLVDQHRALMARLLDTHDRDAFQELFLHFGPRVKAIMIKAGASHDQAEDIMQDVMMTVWRKVALYVPDRGTVSAWIYTIARNARIDRLRKGSSQPYKDIDDMELASDDANGEDEAFASQRAERVAAAIAELPDEQRQIIELAFVADLPQSEIATKLALPLGTVKSRMRLAYAKLKGKLEELK